MQYSERFSISFKIEWLKLCVCVSVSVCVCLSWLLVSCIHVPGVNPVVLSHCKSAICGTLQYWYMCLSA